MRFFLLSTLFLLFISPAPAAPAKDDHAAVAIF
jgi:hypothetical protein